MTESAASWGDSDTVVLDIGGDVGAVVLYTGGDLLGAEIDISPSHNPSSRIHAAVRERCVNGRTTCAAIFCALSEGAYCLWRDEDTVGATVTVVGAEISTVDWRPSAPGRPSAEHGRAVVDS